ncbi:kinesin-like protein KIF16B [Phodopus roborovskii]|uniref:kinesin-like protein KIF16B n=1 Tax=Phodopus roborovskii TaxID=109678 RepID=UPI0021E3D16A|nr:kinesin-like protein KIF16B [Phodopus roborovskii]
MYSRSLGANPDDLKDPIKISIPRYVLCGQGKDEHFEFEVKPFLLCLPEGIPYLSHVPKLIIFISVWLECLRVWMIAFMGGLPCCKLAALEFPPKKLFGNKDERVVAERRTHLEKYLREFFSVMLQSATSPLHINKVGLTLSKHTICEFSPFFKKGVFDYSSHGTG